jgi:hypothetical protein
MSSILWPEDKRSDAQKEFDEAKSRSVELLFHIKNDAHGDERKIDAPYEVLDTLQHLLEEATVSDDGHEISVPPMWMLYLTEYVEASLERFVDEKPKVFPEGSMSVIEALYQGEKVQATKAWFPLAHKERDEKKWQFRLPQGRVTVPQSELTLLRVICETQSNPGLIEETVAVDSPPVQDEQEKTYTAKEVQALMARAFDEGAVCMADQISEDNFGGRVEFTAQFENLYRPSEDDQ